MTQDIRRAHVFILATDKDFMACHEQVKGFPLDHREAFCASNGTHGRIPFAMLRASSLLALRPEVLILPIGVPLGTWNVELGTPMKIGPSGPIFRPSSLLKERKRKLRRDSLRFLAKGLPSRSFRQEAKAGTHGRI